MMSAAGTREGGSNQRNQGGVNNAVSASLVWGDQEEKTMEELAWVHLLNKVFHCHSLVSLVAFLTGLSHASLSGSRVFEKMSENK